MVSVELYYRKTKTKVIHGLDFFKGHLEKSQQGLIQCVIELKSDHTDMCEPWAREAFGTNSKESPSSRTKSRCSSVCLIRAHPNYLGLCLKGGTRKSARATQGASESIH